MNSAAMALLRLGCIARCARSSAWLKHPGPEWVERLARTSDFAKGADAQVFSQPIMADTCHERASRSSSARRDHAKAHFNHGLFYTL